MLISYHPIKNIIILLALTFHALTGILTTALQSKVIQSVHLLSARTANERYVEKKPPKMYAMRVKSQLNFSSLARVL